MHSTGDSDNPVRRYALVSRLLMADLEALDAFERMLAAVVPQAAGGMRTADHTEAAAELLADLRINNIVHLDSSDQPVDGFDALRRVQHNTAELARTISMLLVEVCLSQMGAEADLTSIVERAQRAMSTFAADPAAPVATGPAASHGGS